MIRRNEMTWMRLTTGERRTLESAAAKAGKPLSTWIRDVALEAAHSQRMLASESRDAVSDLFSPDAIRGAWSRAG